VTETTALEGSVIAAALDCPGECIFVEPDDDPADAEIDDDIHDAEVIHATATSERA
jgi:hypothetical protein